MDEIVVISIVNAYVYSIPINTDSLSHHITQNTEVSNESSFPNPGVHHMIAAVSLTLSQAGGGQRVITG